VKGWNENGQEGGEVKRSCERVQAWKLGVLRHWEGVRCGEDMADMDPRGRIQA
jgi:hypothetical protein